MKKTYIFYLFSFIALFIGCSDFDEQEFTVLLPDAGEDQVIFTEETGTSIQLDGTGSSDVNDIGFDYLWEIIEFPEGFSATISNPNIASPTLEVPSDTGGRYQLRLTTFIGDQLTQDIVNVDVNPANAQILFVNAIDSSIDATFRVPAVDIIGNPVAARNTGEAYHNIDTNISSNDDGATLIEVEYNGQAISTNQTLEALKSYTLYLVGSEENPEILFIEKQRNQNSIPAGLGLVALDAINLAEGTDNVILRINAGALGGINDLDILLTVNDSPETFGTLNYQDNAEIFFSTGLIFPLPIWAASNDEQRTRLSNDVINLLESEGEFGTFMLFPDASAENGHTLLFVNNSELLPL